MKILPIILIIILSFTLVSCGAQDKIAEEIAKDITDDFVNDMQDLVDEETTQFDVGVVGGLKDGYMRGLKEISLEGKHSGAGILDELSAALSQGVTPFRPLSAGDVIMLNVTRVSPSGKNRKRNNKKVIVWYVGFKYQSDKSIVSSVLEPLT